MNRKFFSLALILVLVLTVSGAALAEMPKSWREFKERFQYEAKKPEAAIHMYFEAVFAYTNAINGTGGASLEDAGKMLRYVLHCDRPIEQSQNLRTFVERLKDPDMHHIFKSYCKGTSPDDDYEMDPDNFTVNIVSQKPEQGYLRVFLKSSGADNDRPIQLEQFNGLWYVTNNAGTYVSVREPRSLIERRENAHDPDADSMNDNRNEIWKRVTQDMPKAAKNALLKDQRAWLKTERDKMAKEFIERGNEYEMAYAKSVNIRSAKLPVLAERYMLTANSKGNQGYYVRIENIGGFEQETAWLTIRQAGNKKSQITVSAVYFVRDGTVHTGEFSAVASKSDKNTLEFDDDDGGLLLVTFRNSGKIAEVSTTSQFQENGWCESGAEMDGEYVRF